MNLGILAVQGLVNSFGPTIMAAFAAAVKIDAFAYMPVQDFRNAFSTFIAQNYGAKKKDRIQAGLKAAVFVSLIFSIGVSIVVWVFASPLMTLFVPREKLKLSWRAFDISILKVPFTAESVRYSFSTACTGPLENQGCPWRSPLSLWGLGLCWPTSCLLCQPWA